jgi:hypothetical protein
MRNNVKIRVSDKIIVIEVKFLISKKEWISDEEYN